MSAAAVHPQDIPQPRPQPAGVFPRHTEVRRNAVGVLKLHTDLLAAQGVRIIFQYLGSIGAPAPPCLDCRRGGQPQRSQQAHHGTDPELSQVLLPYFARFLCRDSPHLSQPFRFFFYNGEGIITEACHNAPRQCWADALNRTGGKIFPNCPCRGG